MAMPKSTDSHRFPWKWNLTDLEDVQKHDHKVFSTFSCGGGSSMGYKLAGYTMVGNCEIDPDMNKIYNTNHHPKYSFLMDIRELISKPNDELPSELFDLDILDRSPPCSVFSMAGEREGGWGKEKVFREGQAKQRLDDLFFEYIRLADKLKPKICIAENVKGLITGKSKGYVNEIIKAFKDAGYVVQLFLLNAASMGVPQARERVFFVCHREDLELPKLKLNFNEPPIPFRDVRSDVGIPVNPDTDTYRMLQKRRPEDKKMSHIRSRIDGRESGYTSMIFHDERPATTLASGGGYYRMYDGMALTRDDIVSIQTFPQDYNFMNQSPQYVCGMSVPPVMMANIAFEVYKQWLNK